MFILEAEGNPYSQYCSLSGRYMKTGLNILIILTLITCVLTLVLSIYPGVIQDIFTFITLALLWLAIAVGIAIALLAIVVQRGSASVKNSLARIGAILLMVVCSYGMLKFYIPRQIGFLASRTAFEGWLAQNPPKNYTARSLNKKLGIYHVDQYAADPRGGVYFRVYRGRDGLGPDTISYGFAYQPNLQGSPFGAAYYGIYPLGNGWFWFQASNDW